LDLGYLRLNGDGTWKTNNPDRLGSFINGEDVVQLVEPKTHQVLTYRDGEKWLRLLHQEFWGGQGLSVGRVVEMPELGLDFGEEGHA
jgi:hypothetical protein